MSALSDEELAAKVERGITWLAEHDPKGVFNLWYEAGIQPGAKLPALENPQHPQYIEGRAENYAQWVKQLRIWRTLYAELERRNP